MASAPLDLRLIDFILQSTAGLNGKARAILLLDGILARDRTAPRLRNHCPSGSSTWRDHHMAALLSENYKENAEQHVEPEIDPLKCTKHVHDAAAGIDSDQKDGY